MIIDDIKEANKRAMRDQDSVARAIFSILINKYLVASIDKRENKQEMQDSDTVAILQKTIKELEEETENYKKVNNITLATETERQKIILEQFLPEMMSSEEVDEIIKNLPDKSLPAIMKYFKENYAGKVDMRMVSIKAKSWN